MYQALPIGVEVGLLLEDLLATLDPNEDHYTTYDIIAALPHTQLTYLGNGAYGVAASAHLSDGREIVLKLAGRSIDGYPWWAEHCKDNPAKHLPEVYYTARVGALHVTAMKRYEPMGADHEMKVRHVNTGYDTGSTLACAVAETAQLIRSHSGSLDMHLGNYMCDPETDEIVITDPCSYMPPAGGDALPPRQLEINFEIDNMGTAINSLLGALRKAEEQHGADQPGSITGKLDKDLQRWTMPPANRLLGMDFADAAARVGMAMAGKVDDEFMKFIRNKWG